MAVIFCSASKGGREIEHEFTTEDRAEADLFFNNYYIPGVVRVEVSDDDFIEVQNRENDEEKEAEEWGEPTQYQRYKSAA